MTWLLYGALAYVVYKIAIGAVEKKKAAPKKPPKKKVRKKVRPEGRTPHEVLGVEPDASLADIRRAYQQKMQKYHPDRVANAADELQALAEQRSKEINAAYDVLVRRAQS